MPNRINELELLFIGTTSKIYNKPIELNIQSALSTCTCITVKLNFWGTGVLVKRYSKLEFWGCSSKPVDPSTLFYQVINK